MLGTSQLPFTEPLPSVREHSMVRAFACASERVRVYARPCVRECLRVRVHVYVFVCVRVRVCVRVCVVSELLEQTPTHKETVLPGNLPI